MNKVLASDVFVWLHCVQYRKNYFQNRTLIRNVDHTPLWLTIPVHAGHSLKIDEVRVADSQWQRRAMKTIEQCYRKAPYFDRYWPPLREALERKAERLEEVNLNAFHVLLDLLGCSRVRLVRAGELPAMSDEPTMRLLEICRHIGATVYIAGKGGHNYLETEAFNSAGIQVIWQSFDPMKSPYPQSSGTFLPGLSFIDCLFFVGAEEARRLATEAWKP